MKKYVRLFPFATALLFAPAAQGAEIQVGDCLIESAGLLAEDRITGIGHVRQPAYFEMDLSMTDDELVAWTEMKVAHLPGTKRR